MPCGNKFHDVVEVWDRIGWDSVNLSGMSKVKKKQKTKNPSESNKIEILIWHHKVLISEQLHLKKNPTNNNDL